MQAAKERAPVTSVPATTGALLIERGAGCDLAPMTVYSSAKGLLFEDSILKRNLVLSPTCLDKQALAELLP